MKRTFGLLVALAGLVACETPDEPTVTSRDIDRAFAEASRISRLPITPVADLPTGSVTYDGQIGANIDGELNGSILADMTMVVGFDTNRVSGGVSNINYIDDRGAPDQRLDGTLQISGFETNGNLDAGASGIVSGVDGGVVFDTEINLDLQGEVRDDLINGDAINGAAVGRANGDVDFNIDGVFFGTER